jgi:hypothetical protein
MDKWNAWRSRKGMTAEAARAEFVTFAQALLTKKAGTSGGAGRESDVIGDGSGSFSPMVTSAPSQSGQSTPVGNKLPVRGLDLSRLVSPSFGWYFGRHRGVARLFCRN